MHIVHKEKVTIQVAKAEDARTFQGQVSRLLQNELPAKMEVVFDKLVPADEIMRIDKLQLDLGIISRENFEEEFQRRVISKLQEAISKAKDEHPKSRKAGVISKTDSLLHALLHFLQYGYLPWYSLVQKIHGWEEDILIEFKEKDWHDLVEWLQKNSSLHPQIIPRLIEQFSDNFREELFFKPGLRAGESLKKIFEDLFFITDEFLLINKTEAQERAEKKNLLWKILFNDLMFTEKDLKDVIFRILVSLFYKQNDAAKEIILSKKSEFSHSLKTVVVKEAFSNFTRFLEVNNPDDKKVKITDLPPDAFVEMKENLFKEENIAEKKTNSKEDQLLKQRAKYWNEEAKEDTLYANNCGIVLLHPFLEMYFEELGLLADKQFMNDDAQKHAVLLLHYLASGETEVAEFHLVLQKILCGLALEESLPAEIVLSQKELDESEKLLVAVIGYWPPLKNTSLNGFRNTFLQREGTLSLKESGWLLNVEQKTVDILLGKLPWGFSTIHFPWMKNIVSVDWY